MNLLNKSLYDIVNQNKEIADFIYAKQVIKEDEQMLNTIGKRLTLSMALQAKKINREIFLEELKTHLASSDVDVTLSQPKEENKAIKVKGVLPCPVRIQMLEKVEEFRQQNDCSDISIELQAASMGLSWLKDGVKNAKSPDDIADMFLSAGFELFFDQDLIGKFRNQAIFKDYTGVTKYNSDFENEYISLKDPHGMYSVLAVVPAVFLINENELNGREIPTSWADILSEEWENSVSLSVGDFDMFNSVLLNIYKLFGEEGIKKLARSFHKSLHPSEMVTSNRKEERPAINIMPLFFSKMAKKPLIVVWPKEGAVLSPIFLLSKKEKQKELQALVDLMSSKEIGEILSHQGRFPSTHPQVDNMLEPGQKFVWIGWEMIHRQDIGELIIRCKEIFEENCGISLRISK